MWVEYKGPKDQRAGWARPAARAILLRRALVFEAHRLLYHSAQGPSRTCNESKEEDAGSNQARSLSHFSGGTALCKGKSNMFAGRM